MACYRNNVINTAKGEEGYTEGQNNWNKYADYIDHNYPNFYNYPKQNVEWCEVFFDYCVLVNCSTEAEAEYVLCQPKKSAGAGCKESYAYYKKQGRVGKDPQLGAQVYFGSSEATIKHTGMVINVTADKIYTMEGNSGNQVKAHSYSINSSKIFGYGYPRYSDDAKPEPQPTPEPAPTPVTSSGSYTVKTNTGVILKIRQKPTTKSKHIGSISNGSTLYAQEIVKGESVSGNTDWAKTTYKGITGYASCKYLVKHTDAKTYTVSVDSYLNVRTGPGTNYSTVGKLYNEDVVNVYQTKGNWACIGNKQWVSMTYLK